MFALFLVLLLQVPTQIDPAVPVQIPEGDQANFKLFLDRVLESVLGSAANPVLDLGRDLWRGMAVIVIVWTGLKIAFSGSIEAWEIVRLVFGLWIPWVMLQFYAVPLPGMALSFPEMIAGGGTWLQRMFLEDTVSSMQTQLGDLVNNLAADLEAARQGGLISMVVTGAGRTLTLVAGAIIMLLVVLCLALLFAVTYAQVIWAQIAIYILIFIGPIFIPWMVFEPLAFMFWGWFKAMITYSLYGLIAGVVMRVFMGVALGFVTTLNTTTLNWDSLADLGRWLLVILPLFVAGILASLKVGALASMLVTGGGGGGSGIGGVATAGAAAASGGAKLAAKGAKAGASGGLK